MIKNMDKNDILRYLNEFTQIKISEGLSKEEVLEQLSTGEVFELALYNYILKTDREHNIDTAEWLSVEILREIFNRIKNIAMERGDFTKDKMLKEELNSIYKEKLLNEILKWWIEKKQ